MSGTIVFDQVDSPTAPAAGKSALSFPATSLNQLKWVDADGGTNIIAGGGFTLTVPAIGTAALLATANVFSANQRVNALVGVNDAPTTGQQVRVLAGATTTIPLVLDTPASPTANLAEFRNNGTAKASISPAGVLALLDKTLTPVASATLSAGGGYTDLAIHNGFVFIFASNGGNSPYYNSALLLTAHDGSLGPNIVIAAQNQSASAETFYVGGATGLALSQVGGGGASIRITNNYAYAVDVTYIALSLA